MNSPNWFLERIHDEDSAKARFFFEGARAGGEESFSRECRFKHREGHTVHTIIKSLPRVDRASPDQVERIEGVIIDISERVFLERAVVQKEKLKTLGAISAEVAHEIRNPLTSIGGFARRLYKQHPDLTECGIIVRETERLERMLERIRNYLTPMEPISQYISICDMLADCVALLQPEIEQKDVSCIVDVDSGLSRVYADPGMLKQVFINLIRNAVTDMDRTQDLIMKAQESANSVDIIFENHVSHPQKMSDPEKLFLPFDEGGTSIGLPLCYRLVKIMGGVLMFRRRNRKMIFTVSFPKRQDDMVRNGSDRNVGDLSTQGIKNA